MTDEVRSLRADHNGLPDHCIEAVALALRRTIDPAVLDRTLSLCPQLGLGRGRRP